MLKGRPCNVRKTKNNNAWSMEELIGEAKSLGIKYPFNVTKENLCDLLSSNNININASVQPSLQQRYTEDDADLAIMNGDIILLKKLLDLGIYPSLDGPIYAGENGRLDILVLLASKYNIIGDVDTANEAAKHGYIDILEFLSGYGVYPDVLGANNAARHGRSDVLEWLYVHGILPDYRGAEDAYYNEYDDIVEWLEFKGIRPKEYIRKEY